MVILGSRRFVYSKFYFDVRYRTMPYRAKTLRVAKDSQRHDHGSGDHGYFGISVA
jgi:hypothetical protein